MPDLADLPPVVEAALEARALLAELEKTTEAALAALERGETEGLAPLFDVRQVALARLAPYLRRLAEGGERGAAADALLAGVVEAASGVREAEERLAVQLRARRRIVGAELKRMNTADAAHVAYRRSDRAR